jgi:hypothetical protein
LIDTVLTVPEIPTTMAPSTTSPTEAPTIPDSPSTTPRGLIDATPTPTTEAEGNNLDSGAVRMVGHVGALSIFCLAVTSFLL